MNEQQILEMLHDWNLWGGYSVASVARPEYQGRLASASKAGEVVTVKGVRRGGKSTLLVQLLRRFVAEGVPAKNTLVINCEDPRFGPPTLETLTRVHETYLAHLAPEGRHLVVLDEAVAVAGWERLARMLSESGKAGVFVTGSSSKMFSEEYATLLAGRHLDVPVFPLSFREFLGFRGLEAASLLDWARHRHRIRHLLNEFLENGGFPKVALVDAGEKKHLLESYYNDILIKDVQRRFKIRASDKLDFLAKYYLANISTVQPCNRVKVPVGLSLDSVERFSGYFALAGFFHFVRKFSFSLKEQLLNPRKVYVADTGLRNAMGFRFSADLGRVMENVVCLELVRRGHEVFYWRSAKAREVDFVVRAGGRTKEVIQVCFDPDDPATLGREMDALADSLSALKCGRMSVITGDREGTELLAGRIKVRFVPLWKWLLGNAPPATGGTQ